MKSNNEDIPIRAIGIKIRSEAELRKLASRLPRARNGPHNTWKRWHDFLVLDFSEFPRLDSESLIKMIISIREGGDFEQIIVLTALAIEEFAREENCILTNSRDIIQKEFLEFAKQHHTGAVKLVVDSDLNEINFRKLAASLFHF